jgi:hypothetical protein
MVLSDRRQPIFLKTGIHPGGSVRAFETGFRWTDGTVRQPSPILFYSGTPRAGLHYSLYGTNTHTPYQTEFVVIRFGRWMGFTVQTVEGW